MRTALILLAAALAPLAAAERWRVDPAASTVAFHCSTTWHDFDGSARISAGEVVLDGERSSGEVVVAVASMATGKDSRDAKMRDEVLAGAAHPLIRFTLTRFDPAPGGGTAHGQWTMHGTSQLMQLPVTLADGHARASFTLDITRWGIQPPSVVVNRMAKEVVIDLDLRLLPAP